MNIASTQGTTSTTSSNGTVQSGDGLGRDSFLQLLITQMRYQDPLEPASDTEYISQLAQFNSLEQMQNLNDNFTKMLKWSQMTQASSLIGKQVEAIVTKGIDTDKDGKIDTAKVTGTVAQVNYVDGEPMLIVAGQEVMLSEVMKILPEPVQVEAQTYSSESEEDESEA
jgi:flagellar basal-body rod modification protein FlgD